MVYDWIRLGVKEITNLFLYGTPTTPSDRINDSLIRPKDVVNGPRCGADIDVVIYGGAGDDWIEGGQGNDLIDAGADNEWRLAA